MSGPFCKDCDHYKPYHIGDGGECTDSAKMISVRGAGYITDHPTVRPNYECCNHSGVPPNRELAIKTIRRIQCGEWDRNTPRPPTGTIAAGKWLDPVFGLGMEYGAIVALMQIYDISIDEIK